MRDSADSVVIECFAIRMTADDGGVASVLAGRHVIGSREHHPDRDAARLVGLDGGPLDGIALLHSTSWRWDPSLGLVVTYLCCPDPQPTLAGVMIPAAARHGDHDDNPSRPHAADVALSDVLHHGIDHLAWLADHHPHLTMPAQRLAPGIWDAIHHAGRHRATQLGRRPPPARSSSVDRESA